MARIRRTKKGYLVDFYLDGKRVRKVLPTREIAKQYMADETVRANEEKYFGVKQEEFATFGELADWYAEHPKVTRKKSHDKTEQVRMRTLKDHFGKMEVRNIGPEQIEEFVSMRLQTINRRGRPNKPATINREITLMKAMFNLAEKTGKTRHNPTKTVVKLSGEEERDRVLSAEEWEAYYSHCPEWYKPIALCLYLTGMRLGEILNLQWDRVDRKTGFIRLKPEDTKTSKGRRIPIDPELEEALKGIPRSLTGYVFTRDGNPLQPWAAQYPHKVVCNGADISNFRIHDFRHTCITNWVDSGANIFVVQEASGHKKLEMLRRYYTVSEDALSEMVQKRHGQNPV